MISGCLLSKWNSNYVLICVKYYSVFYEKCVCLNLWLFPSACNGRKFTKCALINDMDGVGAVNYFFSVTVNPKFIPPK